MKLSKIANLAIAAPLILSACVVYPNKQVSQNYKPVNQIQQKRFVTDYEHGLCAFIGDQVKNSRMLRSQGKTLAESKYFILKTAAKYKIDDNFYNAADWALDFAYNTAYDELTDIRLANIAQTECIKVYEQQ